MTTGHCFDCKWFGKPFFIEQNWTSKGLSIATMALCGNPKLCMADDGIESTYDAPTQGFYVGPNFGCVHFEQKS